MAEGPFSRVNLPDASVVAVSPPTPASVQVTSFRAPPPFFVTMPLIDTAGTAIADWNRAEIMNAVMG